jgi:O-antigen ligase
LVITNSRSAFVGLGGGLGTLAIFSSNRNKKTFKYLGMIFVSTIVIIFIFKSQFASSYDDRFGLEQLIATGGTGRIDTWKGILHYIVPNHYLFGLGYGSDIGGYLNTVSELIYGAHNIVFAIIAETGFVGLLGYSIFAIYYSYKIMPPLKLNNELLLSLALVLTAICNGIGENIYSERFLWIVIGLGFGLLNSTKDKINENI